MKKFTLVAVGSLVGACRAVLGIEDLGLVDAGSSDGGVQDGASSSGDSGPPGKDADVDPTIAACKSAAQCRPCCHGSYNDALKNVQPEMIQCLCGPTVCKNQCSAPGELCSNNPSGTPPGESCGPCIDDAYIKGTGNCNAPCKSRPECKAELDCMVACPNK